MDIPWEDIRLFLAVAEGGSVSAAARRLRLGQPTVSRRLADLEYRVGAALFRRSAHGAALTTAGARMLPSARRMAEWASELERSVRGQEVTGVVRVAAAPGVAADLVAPFARWLGTAHPGLRLDVTSGIHSADLLRGEADLSLRIRSPVSPGLLAVGSVSFDSAAFATEALAASLPTPLGWAQVPWIAWAAPFDRLPPNPLLEAQIPAFSPVFSSDNFLVNLAAAEAGVGAVVLPKLRHRFSRATGLVPLDLDLGPEARGSLQLVCVRSAYDVPRIRLVADALAAELAHARLT